MEKACLARPGFQNKMVHAKGDPSIRQGVTLAQAVTIPCSPTSINGLVRGWHLFSSFLSILNLWSEGVQKLPTSASEPQSLSRLLTTRGWNWVPASPYSLGISFCFSRIRRIDVAFLPWSYQYLRLSKLCWIQAILFQGQLYQCGDLQHIR